MPCQPQSTQLKLSLDQTAALVLCELHTLPSVFWDGKCSFESNRIHALVPFICSSVQMLAPLLISLCASLIRECATSCGSVQITMYGLDGVPWWRPAKLMSILT